MAFYPGGSLRTVVAHPIRSSVSRATSQTGRAGGSGPTAAPARWRRGSRRARGSHCGGEPPAESRSASAQFQEGTRRPAPGTRTASVTRVARGIDNRHPGAVASCKRVADTRSASAGAAGVLARCLYRWCRRDVCVVGLRPGEGRIQHRTFGGSTSRLTISPCPPCAVSHTLQTTTANRRISGIVAAFSATYSTGCCAQAPVAITV